MNNLFFSSIRQNKSDSSMIDSGSKCLFIIDLILLRETLSNNPSFSLGSMRSMTRFGNINPFSLDSFSARRKEGNRPCLVNMMGKEFRLHGCEPFFSMRRRDSLIVGDRVRLISHGVCDR